MKRIFWLAGENSGDLHSSKIIAKLNANGYHYDHFGIGGKFMESEGFTPVFDFSRFAVMGITEVLSNISFFLQVERNIKKIFYENPPDLVILVDYPGLNMRVARMAKLLGIPVVYYICPQFWAWKQKRIHQLKRYTDHVACILPFETETLDKHKIPCSYVGHPICEEIEMKTDKDEFARIFDLDPNKKWLGFLPGSRNGEIRHILPEMLKTIALFDKDKYEFLLSKAPSVNEVLFQKIIDQASLSHLKIIPSNIYEIMAHADFLTVTSGTASLETALIGTPFIIVYKVSWLSYLVAKNILSIRNIGLPNIILKKEVIPELIQNKATAKNIYEHINEFITKPQKISNMKSHLNHLNKLLGKKSASEEMSKLIIRFVENE